MLAIVLLAACGTEYMPDESLGGVQAVFTRYCAPGCHSGQRPDGDLSLEPGRAQLELVGVTTVSYCGIDGIRVQPGEPEASCLWQLVRDDTMPLERPPLANVYKDRIYQWILDGAAD